MVNRILRALSCLAIILFPALVFAQSHSATVSWTPATQPNGVTIASWNLQRGTTSGGPYTQVASIPADTTSFKDTSVSSGQNYFYVVQAVDTNNDVSANSTEVEAIIPTGAPPLAVSTTSLPPATVGSSYSVTISASGGTGPYTWSGTGADGLMFSATGLLSGTPSQAGTFPQSVTVQDSVGATATVLLTLTVTAALTISTTQLPAATAGTSYSTTLTPTGGTAPYTWSGTGADGLTFSSTGVLSGTPAQAGTFAQSVTVKDSVGATASASLTLTVTAALTISTTQLPAATAGTSYSTTLTATGGTAPYTWSGTGADGLTFSATGVLSGTPAQAGTFPQSVTVQDSTGATASASLTLTVTAALTISTSQLPAAIAGGNYSATLAATGGTAPYTWSGTGADGLTLGATGVLSGTPAQAGTFAQSVTVKDSVGATASASLTLTVTAALTISTTSLPPATAGTSYSTTLAATGGTAPYTWSGTGADGLTLGATGVLSGTPAQAGTFPESVTVKDSTGATASASLTLNVTAALTISTSQLPAAIAGGNYSATLAATGGTAPYTWSGTGADGLTLGATGVLSGTPAQAGTFPQAVTVKDSTGATASASLTLNVTAALTISTTSLPPATAGTSYSTTLTATGGTTPYTWSGTGADGLTLDATGVLSGTPAQAGTFPQSATVKDSTGATASASLTLNVAAPVPPLLVSTTQLPAAIAGSSYSATLAATGGTAPYTWSGTGADGLTLDATGVLSGTPAQAGTFPQGVTVQDSAGATASASLTLSVAASSSTTLAAINPDAHISADANSPSTAVNSPAFSTAAGNELLLAFIATDANGGTNATVTGVSGGGLGWTLVVRANVRSGTSEIWRAFAPSMLSNVSVTATLSQSVVSSMTVMSFTGVDTSGTNGAGAIGATKAANGIGTPTATLTTTHNNSWIFGVGNDYDNAIVRAPGAAQTIVHQDLSPTGDTYWVQMQNAPTPLSGTSVSINDAAPTGDQYNLAIVELLPSSTAPSPTYSISGTISGAVVGGVTLNLSGSSAASTVTDASGNYVFTGLSNGGYIVTPGDAGFTFTPASQSATVSDANAPGVDFTSAAIPTYSISGTIFGAVVSGVAVNLSGTSSVATTTDASGNFTFAGLSNGSYTVTPSAAGYTFTPSNQPATINSASIPGVNFTSQAVTSPSTGSPSTLAMDANIATDSGPVSTIASPQFSTNFANELLLAFISTDYLSGSNTTVTGVNGAGLVWVLVARTNSQSGTSEIWRAFASSPLSNVTVTATLSQTVVSSMTVISFTGVDTSGTNGSGAIGATKSASSWTGAPTARLVTTRNNSWVFGVGNDYDNAILRVPGTGQSLIHQDLSLTGDTYWVQMRNAPTPLSGTSVAISDTAPIFDRYNLAICEILPAP